MTAAIAKPSDELVEIEVADIPVVPSVDSWEELREVTRCTGHCCRSFTLGNMSPVDLGQKVIKQRRHQAGEVVEGEPCRPETADWIATVLVYQGKHDRPPSGLSNITKPPGREYEASKKTAHWYGCRHLDGGSCAIYDSRPDVCRDYPYKGNQCHNPGCTRRTTMASGLSWWRLGESDEELVKATEVEDGVDEEVRGAAQGAQEGPRDEPGRPGQGNRSQRGDDQPVGAVLRGVSEVPGRHGARRCSRGVGPVSAL